MGSDNSNQIEVLTTAQNLTDAMANLGAEIDTRGYNYMLIWIDLDINLSNNARIQPLAKRAAAAALEYGYPIYSAGTTDVGVENLYFEWTTDEDKQTMLEINLKGMIPYIQLQVMAEVVGGTAGQIESCYVHLI